MIELSAFEIALLVVPAVLPHLRALVKKTPSELDNQALALLLKGWDFIAGNYGAAENKKK